MVVCRIFFLLFMPLLTTAQKVKDSHVFPRKHFFFLRKRLIPNLKVFQYHVLMPVKGPESSYKVTQMLADQILSNLKNQILVAVLRALGHIS